MAASRRACKPRVEAPDRILAPLGVNIRHPIRVASTVGEALTVAVTGLPEGLSWDGSAMTISGRITNLSDRGPAGGVDPGAHDVEISVSDRTGSTVHPLQVVVMAGESTGAGDGHTYAVADLGQDPRPPIRGSDVLAAFEPPLVDADWTLRAEYRLVPVPYGGMLSPKIAPLKIVAG